MLRGKCPNCGLYRFGWALRNPLHQVCPKCGVVLEITEGGGRLSTGDLPFASERDSINLPNNLFPYRDNEEESSRENWRDHS